MSPIYRLAAIEKRQTTPRLVISRFEADRAQQITDAAGSLAVVVAVVFVLAVAMGVFK